MDTMHQDEALIAVCLAGAEHDARERGPNPYWSHLLWNGQTEHRLPICAALEEVFGEAAGISYALNLAPRTSARLAWMLRIPSWGQSAIFVLAALSPLRPVCPMIFAAFVLYLLLRAVAAALLAERHNKRLPDSWDEERYRVIYEHALELLPDDLRSRLPGVASN